MVLNIIFYLFLIINKNDLKLMSKRVIIYIYISMQENIVTLNTILFFIININDKFT